jgi:hypothetical protein
MEDTLTKEYKALANHLQCEACKGHCHVMRNGAHQRLDYKEMSYWAKQIVHNHFNLHSILSSH